MTYKNITIVGGSGNLGPAIITELLAVGLNVTVTTRKESKSTFSDDVKVARTDYTVDSLVDIFKGQDAVICTLGGDQIGQQKAIIDAAVKAGVKRYFPSEFGGDTRDFEQTQDSPLFKQKHEITSYVKSKEDELEWTAVLTGPFFDWGFKVGFLDFDLKNTKASIWDGGDVKISMTNTHTIGKALAAIFTKPEVAEVTKNQYIATASHTVTQNEILAGLEELTGAKWQTSAKDAQEEADKARKSLAQGNQYAVYDIIKAGSFGKNGHGDATKLPGGIWNDRLGLANEDLKEDLKKALAAT